MTREELIKLYGVEYKGEVFMLLNPNIVEMQAVSPEGIEKLKKLHGIRVEIEVAMITAKGKALKDLNKDWVLCQFELQKAWGFTEDSNYHRFWEVPQCECPNLDNIDDYPYRQHINLSCPVHGSLLKERT